MFPSEQGVSGCNITDRGDLKYRLAYLAQQLPKESLIDYYEGLGSMPACQSPHAPDSSLLHCFHPQRHVIAASPCPSLTGATRSAPRRCMGCGGSKSKNAVDISKKRQLNVTSPVPEKLSTLLPQSGPLPTSNYWSRLSLSDSTQEVTLEKAQYSLKYAYTSLRGFYPDALTKRNQDDICAHQLFGHEAEQLLFAVFDGHGTEGHLCAQFAKNKVRPCLDSLQSPAQQA